MPEKSKGFAAEYGWDGHAVDGSGRMMKDDPRVVMLDNFNDYEDASGYPNFSTHIKGSGDPSPKRWMGLHISNMSFDRDEKYSGNYSLKLNIPKKPGSYGAGINQWVDYRALRGEPINDEPFTARRSGENIPKDGFPVEPGVRPREGGYTELFSRVMFKYKEGFDLYGHNGMGFSGGWNHRPAMGGIANHPGGTAGYRSNGCDLFLASVEPEARPGVSSKRPGFPNIYYYGAEQVGIYGNHYFSDGRVQPSTGGDRLDLVDRKDGVNGFKAYPLKELPVGEWFCMEYQIRLNTVVKNGKSLGPNTFYPSGTPHATVNDAEPGSKGGIGPARMPEGCEVKRDGILRVWINGEVVLNYEDVVFRLTDRMTIDMFKVSTWFGGNNSGDTAVWWDNVVLATERIGPVNKAGADPFVRELPPPLPEPEVIPPPPPIAINTGANEVKAGGNLKLTAVINPSDIAGVAAAFGSMPCEVRENYAGGAMIPFNAQWGNVFDFGRALVPGKVMTFYYDSPYDLEKTKSFLKLTGMSDIDINPFFGSDTGPKWHIPIWDWDVNNRYFQLHYDDFAKFTGKTDFTLTAISQFRLLVFIAGDDDSHKENGKVFIGPEPVRLLSARIGDPVLVGWSVSGSTSSSTNIDADGLLTVGADEKAKSVTAKAVLNGETAAVTTIAVL